ncbi:MAG: sulfatase [Opitutales bacterium]|nr:sulfatase [Opitutales bacterium]
MKAIVVMFDSLNRHLLQTYGCDWTVTPNFQRLAARGLTFEKSYVGSMPCMPARRDLHTGRQNFLHRSWGPLEPWDDSCMELLKNAGIHTHIVTDHQHYWEEGAGGNYLSKYSTHEMVRGQEGDPYYAMLPPPEPPEKARGRNAAKDAWHTQDRINRTRICREADMPIAQTFTAGVDFIERHARVDNWLLQIETFDPHEPFFTLEEHRAVYADFYEKSRHLLWDWPAYGFAKESEEEITLMRHHYAALLTLCDAQLGRILDAMDTHDLWKDTLLVVWTDHGFSLGEHDCWAKCWLPFYEEIAHTPFFMWDPRHPAAGERRTALVQPSVDLAPTLLEFFGLAATPDMTGKSLQPVVKDDTPVHETVLFGQFGFQVNITDGCHVYMRGPATAKNRPLNEYTLMPAHMRHAFRPDEFEGASLAQPFAFTKGIAPLRLPAGEWKTANHHPDRKATRLYDIVNDPLQQHPLEDPERERYFCEAILRHFAELDAPPEQRQRLDL